MRKRSVIAAVATGSTVLASTLAATSPAGAAPSPHAVPNSKPSWTAHATHYGHAAASAPVSARVYLSPRGGLGAVKDYAAAVSTPGNALYQKFLTPSQYQSRFGISSTTVSSVSSYLKGAGLKVTGVGAQNRYVTVSGTVKAANKAFSTSIDRYKHENQQVQAPASAVKVPADIAADVLTVTGLDTTQILVQPAAKPAAAPPAGFRSTQPCSQYFGQLQATYEADYKTKLPTFENQTLPYATCGYTGAQFRSAYEGSTTLTGKGVTVGILDAYGAPTIASDANRYATAHGDGAYTSGQLTQSLPGSYTHQAACGPSGWYGEETLDVEAVHAMAPDANIHYYGASSCEDADFVDALTQIVNDDSVQLVSNSWAGVEEGESSDLVAAYESVFLQGATEGISFLFSSGDDGDEAAATGLKQVDYPSSDPYVTGVGGTSVGIGATGTFQFQTGWGTDKYTLASNGKSWTPVGFVYGAGGGTSTLFPKPSYQSAISGGARQVPDVSMDADPNTGMLVGETQTFPDGVYYDEYRIGGTSLASPLFAGMTALALQQAAKGKAVKGVGQLNPIVYSHTADFTDIKGNPKVSGVVRPDYVDGVDPAKGITYSVRTFDQDSSLTTGKGYDQVTGVGSPNSAWFTALP